MNFNKNRSWTVDQLAKSEFFHQKLHEWALMEIAHQIDQVRGETLQWDRTHLEITENAWNKIIHRGIKPVIVSAHPEILVHVARSTSYYRMLTMVSQKSMNQVGLTTVQYEAGRKPKFELAEKIAQHLNTIISKLIATDEPLDTREFDIWRGMAAGAQAQGSWQNTKGHKMEVVLQGIIRRRVHEHGLVAETIDDDEPRIILTDNRMIVFADEPDISFYQDNKIIAAIEIKGGIDKAGVLERIGAAIKSLSRSKEKNPASVTILILPEISMTPKSIADLQSHKQTVNYWFTVEEVLKNEAKQNKIFQLLGI